jgi:hypothetical protein
MVVFQKMTDMEERLSAPQSRGSHGVSRPARRGAAKRLPLTLKEFVAEYYDKIAERHAASTRKTHEAIVQR